MSLTELCSVKMDPRLSEAARDGNIACLHQLLRENPLLLHIVPLYSTQNPLHDASVAGHVDFVREILRLKPDFAIQVNEDGFSAMHVAAANGQIEIVRELIKVDRNVCCLEGRNKRTPLHYAAINGNTDIINEMLLACPECFEAVTIQGETAIHLAVKNYRFEAFRVLMDWTNEMKNEFTINIKDERGNTALLLAIWKKQRQVIELLLGNPSGSLDVNDINCSGLTALDMLLIFPSEAGDREIAEILRAAGALTAREISCSYSQNHATDIPTTPETTSPEDQVPDNLLEYFKFKKGRDPPSEARGTLLIVASLVATVTFQVGISPPGGTWQDNYFPNQNDSSTGDKRHLAGWSILGSSSGVAFALFVLFNSMGFSTSLYMISILTSKFPLQFELQMCMLAMYFSYNTAVTSISPENVRIYVILITIIMSSITPILTRWTQVLLVKLIKFTVKILRSVI